MVLEEEEEVLEVSLEEEEGLGEQEEDYSELGFGLVEGKQDLEKEVWIYGD